MQNCMKPLAGFAFCTILLVLHASPAGAGQFVITRLTHSIQTSSTSKAVAIAEAYARYEGTPDSTDQECNLNTQVTWGCNLGNWPSPEYDCDNDGFPNGANGRGSSCQGNTRVEGEILECTDANGCAALATIIRPVCGVDPDVYWQAHAVVVSLGGKIEKDDQKSGLLGPVECRTDPEGGTDGGGILIQEKPSGSSPIVIRLGDQKFRFTDPAGGVFFDLDADGRAERSAWTDLPEEQAFLVLDIDRSGEIESAVELFGNHTMQLPAPGPNGFRGLAVFDMEEHGGDGDGWISDFDDVWPWLGLWRDLDHDGSLDAGELTSLTDNGILAIETRPRENRYTDAFGNQYRWWGRVLFEDQRLKWAAVDVILVTEEVD